MRPIREFTAHGIYTKVVYGALLGLLQIQLQSWFVRNSILFHSKVVDIIDVCTIYNFKRLPRLT